MIVSRKVQLLIATCVLASLPTYAKQSEPAKRQLKFEVSTTPVELRHRFPEVKYVGYFHVKEDRKLESWLYGVHEMPQWKELSEEQRRFIHRLLNNFEYKKYAINEEQGHPFADKTRGVRTPKGTLSYQVFAVSERDARKIAAAAIARLDQLAQWRRENHRENLERLQKFVAEGEKTLPELQAQIKQLTTRAEEKIEEYVEANYGIESKETIREHAKKSMNDFSYNLRLVDFELIGLQAKIDSIQKYKAGRKGGDSNTLIKLDQMYIAADVERAGALARKGACEAAFKQANELYALIKSRDAASYKEPLLRKKLIQERNRLPEAEELVVDPPRYTFPVEVYENKVTIYPVQVD